MPSEQIDVGDVVVISVNIKNLSNNDIDPTTLAFWLKDPSGAITQYTYGTDSELVKDSTGNYHVDYTTVRRGRHRYRFTSTGVGEGAAESYFEVEKTYF